MNYVINEDTEKAKELFHQIVVETSRNIYESIMEEDEDMGGQVGDLLDEINAEESGMMEDEDEFDMEIDDGMGDDDVDLEFGGMEDDDLGSIEDSDDHEETLIRIEDKLDQLMAEFDEIMAGENAGDEDLDSDFGDEDMDMDDDFGDEDEDMDMDMDDDFGDEESDEVMEAIQLQKVSVSHGDNGVNKRSPLPANSGKKGMDADVVKFSGQHETVPTSPKAPSNAYTKGQKDLPGAGQFKNSPGHKKADLSSAPKPKNGDDGSNAKSPVAESRRPAPINRRKR